MPTAKEQYFAMIAEATEKGDLDLAEHLKNILVSVDRVESVMMRPGANGKQSPAQVITTRELGNVDLAVLHLARMALARRVALLGYFNALAGANRATFELAEILSIEPDDFEIIGFNYKPALRGEPV